MHTNNRAIPAIIDGPLPRAADVFSGWDGWGPHQCRAAVVTAGSVAPGEVIDVPHARGVDGWVRSAWADGDLVHLTLVVGRSREGGPLVHEETVHRDTQLLRSWSWRLP